ncbi:DUF3226 domain-containing protein [Tunicatimonas pelagia]|uniref:DUF3226 domain-containing protein n=1 Tax=Tunicatimonas pelagia TaxID=931531 RepID=UPI002664EDEE|nr:DUF3226 domain-containing protein [Tunicatimonas pelagia]WKN46072.1 hypothetical protein P0M28_14040 [Tunicatimonas pelagia]
MNITSSKLIAVEGRDEKNFIEAFFKHLNISNTQVLDVAGKDNFSLILPAISKTPGFNSVVKFGIIRDADDSVENAFKSILGALNKASLTQPDSLSTFTDSTPSVGVYIMPDNTQKGMLEDLCLSSVIDEDNEKCLNEFFNCVDTNSIRNISKAKVQAYLSTQPEVVSSVGLAAKKGYWNFTNPCFDDLKSFLLNFK